MQIPSRRVDFAEESLQVQTSPAAEKKKKNRSPSNWNAHQGIARDDCKQYGQEDAHESAVIHLDRLLTLHLNCPPVSWTLECKRSDKKHRTKKGGEIKNAYSFYALSCPKLCKVNVL